jgi:hypothetical protein
MTNKKDDNALARLVESPIASLLVKIVEALEKHDKLVELAGKPKSRPSAEPIAIKKLRELIQKCGEHHKERKLQKAFKKQKETKPSKLKGRDPTGHGQQSSPGDPTPLSHRKRRWKKNAHFAFRKLSMPWTLSIVS